MTLTTVGSKRKLDAFDPDASPPRSPSSPMHNKYTNNPPEKPNRSLRPGAVLHPFIEMAKRFNTNREVILADNRRVVKKQKVGSGCYHNLNKCEVYDSNGLPDSNYADKLVKYAKMERLLKSVSNAWLANERDKIIQYAQLRQAGLNIVPHEFYEKHINDPEFQDLFQNKENHTSENNNPILEFIRKKWDTGLDFVNEIEEGAFPKWSKTEKFDPSNPPSDPKNPWVQLKLFFKECYDRNIYVDLHRGNVKIANGELILLDVREDQDRLNNDENPLDYDFKKLIITFTDNVNIQKWLDPRPLDNEYRIRDYENLSQ